MMTRLKKKKRDTDIISVLKMLTLVMLISCLNDQPVLAQSAGSELSSAEIDVQQQITEGKPIDLKLREIRAEFLVDLLKKYSSQGSRPSDWVYIRHATIIHPLKLDHVIIPFWLSLEDCFFKQDVDFSDSVFQKSLSLRGSKFEGGANFYQMRVDGYLRVNKAQFLNEEKQINFDSINVSNSVYFYQSIFKASFTLSGSTMNELECTDAKFENNETRFRDDQGELQTLGVNANFYNIKVNGNANFTRTSFQGLVNFESIDITKNLELTSVQFDNVSKNIGFSSMRVGGNAIFNQTKFAGGFDMGKADISGNLEFNQTQATNTNPDLPKNFAGMKVDTAIFNQTTLQPPYNLNGADYRLLNPTSEGHQEALAFIEQSVPYSPNPHTSLEAYYRRMGLNDVADDVHIAGRVSERDYKFSQHPITGLPEYLWSWFLHIAVGYGKRLELALVWSILCIGIGYRVFRKEEYMMLQRREEQANYKGKYHPLWYSIALFLPIVDLEDAKIWAPRMNRKKSRFYMRLHIIFGYLLIPVGLAAWTGLIH